LAFGGRSGSLEKRSLCASFIQYHHHLRVVHGASPEVLPRINRCWLSNFLGAIRRSG
jgi:hypothetical protein